MTDNCNLDWTYSDKTGFNFITKKCDPQAKANGRWLQSFQYSGPRLYNSIPLYLRKKCDLSLLSWKNSLDKFLESIPDNPVTSKITSGLCNIYTSRPTNSLIRWIPALHLNGRRADTPPNYDVNSTLWVQRSYRV